MRRYKRLTKYIEIFECMTDFGLSHGCKEVGRDENGIPILSLPYVEYNETVKDFVREVHRFDRRHPLYDLKQYMLVIQSLCPEETYIDEVDESDLSGKEVMAFIYGTIVEERFISGNIKQMLEYGTMLRWLRRLREIDGYERVGGV